MMWFNGIGWSLAGCIQQGLVMVVLWGAVITAIMLAVSFSHQATKRPAGAKGDESHPSSEMDNNDDWHHRLM